MSLKKLIAYTEDGGPEICEFEIECEVLYNIIKSFIDDYKDDFDVEDGRMLKVSKGKVKGLAPIGECLYKKADIIDCLAEVLMVLEIDEDYIEEIREQEDEIIEGLTNVKWLTLDRELGALDVASGIELIDDAILKKVNEANGTSLDRETAMKDESFKNKAMWYLESELQNLMIISEYKQESDTCIRVIMAA